MSGIEEFLAAHTIECTPLHARISRIQCGVNITSGEYGYCCKCPEREHAVFDGPMKKNGLYCNRSENKREGIKMDESAKKYSYSQLARLAGVNAGSVCYALKVIAKGRTDLPEKAARIKAAMDKHGLVLKDGSVYRPEAAVNQPEPASEPTRPVTPEPAGEPADTPQPSKTETRPLGRAIAGELDTWELQKDAANRLAGNGPVPGSIGAVMTLEDILGELRRRLPGATVTIALQ